jgi:dipeptidyl-peptidase-4
MRIPLRRGAAAVLLLALLLPSLASAQQKLLTLDDLYDPQKRVDFTGAVVTGIVWLDDTSYLWAKLPRGAMPFGPGAAGAELIKVNALTGESSPFVDTARMEAALSALPAVGAEEARRLSRGRLSLNPSRTAALVTLGGDLYHYDLSAGKVLRLTNDPAEELDATFSPDGRMIAFTRGGNLVVVDVATGRERQLTTDGGPQLLNGRLDWVYQEELYGRGTYRAFWWSPDSSRLAFLQLDERPVPEFTLVDHVPSRQGLEVFDYPKSGDPNPTVKLGIVRAAGGASRTDLAVNLVRPAEGGVTWVDTSKYSGADHLIVTVGWSPDSRQVIYQLQDREQAWLDLNAAEAGSGASKTLFRETTKAWVDRQEDTPLWLKDGSFLWLSERSGWSHLYHYRADGTMLRQITSGKWELRQLHGVDEAGGWVYFGGTERSHIGNDIYRIKLDGSGMTRLSGPAGTHAATFNPGFTYYVGTWSDINTPAQARLHKADGSEVRVIEANKVESLAQYKLSRPELLQVKTRDGFVMEAMLIKPPDFDPSRKYPVYQQTYAGPHAPQVRNAWGGGVFMYHQFLAQQGIVVWICDNRSASGKGAESAWAAYQRLGETELADIEDGLAWLGQQPWVDAARIGINGWSYGGFMVSYALTHSKSFAMGIAGGSVTDWRLYDSIYTERFMRTPQNNPDGYARTSPLKAAKDLHGKLLLVHGLLDDNVHAQNTVQFAYELQKAGRPFELMLYPKSRHGVTDPQLVRHMRQTMVDFIVRTLRPEGARSQEKTPTAGK